MSALTSSRTSRRLSAQAGKDEDVVELSSPLLSATAAADLHFLFQDDTSARARIPARAPASLFLPSSSPLPFLLPLRPPPPQSPPPSPLSRLPDVPIATPLPADLADIPDDAPRTVAAVAAVAEAEAEAAPQLLLPPDLARAASFRWSSTLKRSWILSDGEKAKQSSSSVPVDHEASSLVVLMLGVAAAEPVVKPPAVAAAAAVETQEELPLETVAAVAADSCFFVSGGGGGTGGGDGGGGRGGEGDRPRFVVAFLGRDFARVLQMPDATSEAAAIRLPGPELVLGPVPP